MNGVRDDLVAIGIHGSSLCSSPLGDGENLVFDQTHSLELLPRRPGVGLAVGKLRFAFHHRPKGIGEVAGSLLGVVGNVPDVVQRRQ
jgi:hypothetical protein